MDTVKLSSPPASLPPVARETQPPTDPALTTPVAEGEQHGEFRGLHWTYRNGFDLILKLTPPAAWQDPAAQGWQRVKDNDRREVWRARIGAAVYYLKYYGGGGWTARLRNLFRTRDCVSEWLGGIYALRAGIAAVAPAGYTTGLDRNGRTCSLLVTEAVEPAYPLNEFWEQVARDDDAARRRRDVANMARVAGRDDRPGAPIRFRAPRHARGQHSRAASRSRSLSHAIRRPAKCPAGRADQRPGGCTQPGAVESVVSAPKRHRRSAALSARVRAIPQRIRTRGGIRPAARAVVSGPGAGFGAHCQAPRGPNRRPARSSHSSQRSLLRTPTSGTWLAGHDAGAHQTHHGGVPGLTARAQARLVAPRAGEPAALVRRPKQRNLQRLTLGLGTPGCARAQRCATAGHYQAALVAQLASTPEPIAVDITEPAGLADGPRPAASPHPGGRDRWRCSNGGSVRS